MSQIKAIQSRLLGTGARTFARQHGSTVLAQGIILGIGVLTGILQARILGPAGRGEFAAISLWPIAIANVVCLGTNQAIAFNLSRRAFTLSEVATASVVLAFVQGALCTLIYLAIAHFAFGSYSHEVRWLGVGFVLMVPTYFLSGYSMNLFQGQQDLERFNIIRASTPFAFALGLLVIYFAHRTSLRLVVFSQLASWVFGVLLGWTLTLRLLRPRFRWNGRVIPSIIDYGYRTQATNLANYFNQRIDQLILSLLVPARQLGFYAVAVTLSTMVIVFPQAAGIVTFSRGSGQHSDDARVTIGESFRASLVWLVLCCTALYLLAPFLIRLVFGPAFSGSILACRILIPGALMLGLNQVLYNGSSALGRPGLPSCAEGISMAITAVGLYVLIPRYGYIGAAVISSIAYTVSFAIMLVLSFRLLGLTPRMLLAAPRRELRAES